MPELKPRLTSECDLNSSALELNLHLGFIDVESFGNSILNAGSSLWIKDKRPGSSTSAPASMSAGTYYIREARFKLTITQINPICAVDHRPPDMTSPKNVRPTDVHGWNRSGN